MEESFKNCLPCYKASHTLCCLKVVVGVAESSSSIFSCTISFFALSLPFGSFLRLSLRGGQVNACWVGVRQNKPNDKPMHFHESLCQSFGLDSSEGQTILKTSVFENREREREREKRRKERRAKRRRRRERERERKRERDRETERQRERDRERDEGGASLTGRVALRGLLGERFQPHAARRFLQEEAREECWRRGENEERTTKREWSDDDPERLVV